MDASASGKAGKGRAQDRESIFLSAKVQFTSRREPVVVRVRNISAGGMMVDCTQPVGPGELLDAEIKNIGRVRGRVAWRTDNRMGIAFDYPIDAKKVRLKAAPDPRSPLYINMDFGAPPPRYSAR